VISNQEAQERIARCVAPATKGEFTPRDEVASHLKQMQEAMAAEGPPLRDLR